MNETLLTTKTALTAALAAIGSFLGWRMIMLILWLTLMCLDYLSGSLAARSRGEWKSETARNGIFHKAGMVLVVLVSMAADLVMVLFSANIPGEVLFSWPVVIFPTVTMWYILTEIGSIIENALSMGARVPQWLPKLLNATVTAIDTAVKAEE